MTLPAGRKVSRGRVRLEPSSAQPQIQRRGEGCLKEEGWGREPLNQGQLGRARYSISQMGTC